MPVLTFKTTDAEALAIRAKARSTMAKSLSDYLRKAALEGPAIRRKIVRHTHPVSGLVCDASPGSLVTDEEIRAALADFP